MRTIVKGKNMDVPESERRYVEQKMARLERLLDDRSEALVELSLERHRSVADSRIVEVTLVIDGRTVRGVARAASHHAAVDEVIDKLERQTVEAKERPREPRRSAGRRTSGAHAEPAAATHPEGPGDEGDKGPRIVKVKRFAIEPMFEEDAVSRMEELGHSFFIFVDAATERLAVLYRRADGDFGLIEPALGGLYTTGRGTEGPGKRRHAAKG